MNVAEWQNRLESTFTESGVVGGLLTPTLLAEQEYSKFVMDNFHGHLVLSDSFQSFFVETLMLAERQFRASALFQTLQSYSSYLLLQLANFRTARAAEILLIHGRPLSGYGLLRDLKDRAIILGAIGNGLTSIEKVLGIDATTVNVQDRREFLRGVKNKRKKEELRAFKEMIGKKSGLPDDLRGEIEAWGEFFHMEVHGARLTLVLEDKQWIRGGSLLPILPTPNEMSVAMYLNRYDEINWMILRTFPFLQLQPKSFGSEWSCKWRILDESFRYAVNGLEQMGKKIATAIIELIDKKFAFAPDKNC